VGGVHKYERQFPANGIPADAPGQSIEVSLAKRVICARVSGTGEITMGAVRRDAASEHSCKAGHSLGQIGVRNGDCKHA